MMSCIDPAPITRRSHPPPRWRCGCRCSGHCGSSSMASRRHPGSATAGPAAPARPPGRCPRHDGAGRDPDRRHLAARTTPAARRALNNHVWRLRRHLGPFATRLQRSASGCRLDVKPTELDLLALDVGIAAARSTLSPDATVEGLEGLVGFAGEAFVRVRRARPPSPPRSLRSASCASTWSTSWLTALLASGSPSRRSRCGVARRCRRAAARATHRLLMSALAADGRSAEAMRAGLAFRRRLTTTTGLDPSGELDELERQGSRPGR